MGVRPVVDDPNLDQARTSQLSPLYDQTLDPIQKFQIPKVLGSSLESRPMEKVIPTVIARNKAETLFQLSDLTAD